MKPGSLCNRCDGTGVVFDEVFANELTECPYMNVALNVWCVEGIIQTMPDLDS